MSEHSSMGPDSLEGVLVGVPQNLSKGSGACARSHSSHPTPLSEFRIKNRLREMPPHAGLFFPGRLSSAWHIPYGSQLDSPKQQSARKKNTHADSCEWPVSDLESTLEIRQDVQPLQLTWLWVKNRYPKWDPGKWKSRLKPAVPR